MAVFTNAQGFPIDARQYLKENTPAIKFPQFQANIPKDGIHAGQYTAFDFGGRPSDTPANTGIEVMPSQIIQPVKDGLGMRVQRYYKKKTAFITTMKIMRQVVNEMKKNYSAGIAMNRQRQMEEKVRSLTGDIRGFTPEMAQLYMQSEGRPNNRAIDTNDMNQLVRTQESDLLGMPLSVVADDTSAPSGGTAGASQVAVEQMGMPDAFAMQEQPIGEGEELPAPMKGERQERLMDAVEAMRDLGQRGGISDDLRESMVLSAESGDDLLGLGLGESPLADRFAGTLEDMVDDEDLLAYEPGMAEDMMSLVDSATTKTGFTREELETIAGDGGLSQGTGRMDDDGGDDMGKQGVGGRPAREAKGRARRLIGEQIAQGAIGRVRSRGRRRKRSRRRGMMEEDLRMDAVEARLEGLIS